MPKKGYSHDGQDEYAGEYRIGVELRSGARHKVSQAGAGPHPFAYDRPYHA